MTDTLLLLMLTFGFLAAVFIPLERLFPRRAQPILRRDWWTDLAFLVGQVVVWRGLAISALGALALTLEASAPTGLRAAVASQPVWLQAALVILVSDLAIYWAHRLSHRLTFLWRFHRVHHTSERLDWLAAYREHPVDGLWTVAVENLPAILLGFRLELIAGFVLFRGIWAVFIHSNVRLPLGPLRAVLGSPELHHWHHDAGRGGQRNFANLNPLMDLLFGTYFRPAAGTPVLGTHEQVPRRYLAQLLFPFAQLLRYRAADAASDPVDPPRPHGDSVHVPPRVSDRRPAA